MSCFKLRFITVVGIICLIVLVAVSGLLGASSQQPQEKDRKPDLQYEVSVVLKLIQVFVTDSKGKPVTDLKSEDFEILDNGQEMRISGFDRPLSTASGAGEISAREPQAAVVSTAPKPKLPRKFYLVFDFFRNDGPGIKRAREAALTFVDKLEPLDEVALILFSTNRGLILREALTADRDRIKRAIAAARDVPYFSSLFARSTDETNLPLASEDDRLASENNEDDTETGGQSTEQRIVWGTADLDRLVTEFISSLSDLAKSLRTVPGFKNVVLYSAGLSYALLYGKAS
jgi:VWFA-related protein